MCEVSPPPSSGQKGLIGPVTPSSVLFMRRKGTLRKAIVSELSPRQQDVVKRTSHVLARFIAEPFGTSGAPPTLPFMLILVPKL